MSWQDDIMIEQERADALNYMGEAEWRDTFEERHGWSPDYEYETRKCNNAPFGLTKKQWADKVEEAMKRADKDQKELLEKARKEEECQGKKSTQQSS